MIDIKPKVSIIIPTYNCSQYLPLAITSVLTQTYKDYEIIVVDDGSTDNTRAVLAEFGQAITYISQENRGPGAARNAGINVSRGDYLVFLDADDLLLPEMLETLGVHLTGHPEVDVAYCDGYLINTDRREKEWVGSFSETGFLDPTLGDSTHSLLVLVGRNAFPIHAAMVRRTKVLEIGCFDEDRKLMVFADWDFWYRLAHQCRFAFIDKKLVLYRMVESGISRDPVKINAACEAIERKIISQAGYTLVKPRYRARLYYELGVILLRSGNRSASLDAFRKAVRIHPLRIRNWIAYVTTLFIGAYALVLSALFRSIIRGLMIRINHASSAEHDLDAILPARANTR